MDLMALVRLLVLAMAAVAARRESEVLVGLWRLTRT
jgi:hypothetical protein